MKFPNRRLSFSGPSKHVDNCRYANFTVLNGLWNNYISELVRHTSHEPTTSVNGPTLLKADYHGALMTVENCRCASRVGICGICVKETKNMFEIVTLDDRLLKIPKEKSLFRVEATLGDEGNHTEIQWRIWGDQFVLRSGERAARKFSGKTIRGKALLEL